MASSRSTALLLRSTIRLVVFRLFLGTAWAGIGMTMPVDGPAEPCNANATIPGTQFQVPSNLASLLPSGYVLPLENPGFLDTSGQSEVAGSCNTGWFACPSTGSIVEQDGRLNPFLRAYAQSRDAKYLLASAVWTALGQAIPNNPALASCEATQTNTVSSAQGCAVALAQLAVTGRQAFSSFSSWNKIPVIVLGSSLDTNGPQLSDLVQLLQSGYPAPSSGHLNAIPPISTIAAMTTPAAIQAAEEMVLTQAYTALWAIRANDPTWRQYRLGAPWIAVSGEDDTPHRPVNVPTAPFPQYDVAVPVIVPVNGQAQSFTLTTRYMFASIGTAMEALVPCSVCSQGSQSSTAPAVPTASEPCRAPGPCAPRLALPPQVVPTPGTPGVPAVTNDREPAYIVYIHGGGSRLEEADDVAKQLLAQSVNVSPMLPQQPSIKARDVVVISVDLPNSAYAEQLLRSTSGGTLISLDASLFEDAPQNNVYNYPVLAFTAQFVTNFIFTLEQQGVISASNLVAVMGGSLGGNLSLLLKMQGQPASAAVSGSSPRQPSPFNAANIPITHPLPPTTAVIAWSPTSMVDSGNTSTIVDYNLTVNHNGPGWGPETAGTRSAYFFHVYFQNTTEFTLVISVNIGGLPPDPEMWFRDDWTDFNGVADCKSSFIAQSRYDRYEVYSDLMRRWTTAIDTEQAIFTFQANTDMSGDTWKPNYNFISGRILLGAGPCDDYDNANGGLPAVYAPWPPGQLWAGSAATNAPKIPLGGYPPGIIGPAPVLSTGTCAGSPIGNTGSNLATHQDIYGFTHDVANDMSAAGGKTFFVNDTGHSIHNERPGFLAWQALDFLSHTADNNVTITLVTNDDDLRENSEVHALFAIRAGVRGTAAAMGLGCSTQLLVPSVAFRSAQWPAAATAGGRLEPVRRRLHKAEHLPSREPINAHVHRSASIQRQFCPNQLLRPGLHIGMEHHSAWKHRLWE